MRENSYWASHFARGSMVQLASAMATFSLRSNVNTVLVWEAHTQWLWPAQPAPKHEELCASQHWMHLHDHHVFCTRPYRSDQSDALGHKWHIFLHNKHRRTKVESKTGAVELAELSHIQYWNIPVNIFLGVEWRESKYNSLALIHNYLKL